MRIIFLLVLALFALTQGRIQELPEASEEWKLFKIKYSKVYSTKSEEIRRKKIFQTNLEWITEHNERYNKGLESFTTGINEQSDWSQEEMSEQSNSWRLTLLLNKTGTGKVMTYNARRRLPASVDWRTKGAVTPVKNQNKLPKRCGSCWAFSAVGSLEGQNFLKYKKLVSLSEQNLLDCSPGYGCGGAPVEWAFDYIQRSGGINTEDSYPYEGVKRECRFNKSNIGATIKGYVRIPPGNEAALQQAVALHGPISVLIHATNPLFKNYRGDGVFEDPTCSPKVLNHAVVLVGYGTTKDGKDYWLVKNSHGTSWGMQGYAMMARNRNNMCGIASSATYPVISYC